MISAVILTVKSPVVTIPTTCVNIPILFVQFAECVFVRLMVLRVSSDFAPKEHKPTDSCSGEVISSL